MAGDIGRMKFRIALASFHGDRIIQYLDVHYVLWENDSGN
jgi:hypothetical protein